MLIRPATAADMAAVARIYDHYVLHTAITFDTEPKPVTEWEAGFARDVADGPYQFLVADVDGQVAAYAHTGQFHIRCAYWTSIFVSVYCAPERTGMGLGPALYRTLFGEVLPGTAFHKVYAGVTQPNEASVKLHERFGFVREGLFAEVGQKFGQWHDVAWYARGLGG
ncbi:MAG TPA: GNAT family N-acetyltransferase [Egibacteraceae bacterium]|nr:GNAT family N-acetyltransferase [Egibacteraceae bacterium]